MTKWLERHTTTRYRGDESTTKTSYLIRNRVVEMGEVRLYFAVDKYIPESLLGRTLQETSDRSGAIITHVWKLEKPDEN